MNSPVSDGSSPITSWSLWRDFHHGTPEVKAKARDTLVQRYQRFVDAVLQKAFRRDPSAPDLIDECRQVFWTRLLQGCFANVHPTEAADGTSRPAFRPYLFRVLSNLVMDHYRARSRAADGLGEFNPAAGESSPADLLIDEERRARYRAASVAHWAESPTNPEAAIGEEETDYLGLYRKHLLDEVMEVLRIQDEKTGRDAYTVLKARAENPTVKLAELARLLSQTGKKRTENGVRVALYRARKRVGDLIRKRVEEDLWSTGDTGAEGCPAPTRQEVDEELAVLSLLDYCRDAD